MIIRKSEAEIERMARAGRVVVAAFEASREVIAPGVRTKEIDGVVHETIRSADCIPSFLGYRGFPASACISINEEIVHGIPGERRLIEGDIVKIDVGAIYEGYHADSAWTFPVGEIAPATKRLLEITEASLWAGIDRARSGRRVGDIGHAVQDVVERTGFSLVREYVGHGVGQNLHEDPQVPNIGRPGKGPKLYPGMALAIEPMVNAGGWETAVLSDEWTVVTADGSLSAHFEHTVVVTSGDPLVLTAHDADAGRSGRTGGPGRARTPGWEPEALGNGSTPGAQVG